MKIPVDDIEESEKETAFDEEVADVNEALALSPAVDYQFRRPVHVRVGYYRAGPDLFFQGHLDGHAAATCARCLETFPFSLEKDFRFVLKPPPADGPPEEEPEPDATFSFYEGDEVDLSPLLREELIVSLPTRALCKEDCAGLCPRCGANRNVNACGCRDEWVDPRLEALRKLKPTQ